MTKKRTVMDSHRRFYTPGEVADLLGVSATTVMTRIHDGVLPAVRVSDRVYRVPVAAFERFKLAVPTPEFEISYLRVKRVRKLTDLVLLD